MVHIGNFFFRWRDTVGSLLIVAMMLLMFVHIPLATNMEIDWVITVIGLLVVLLGSAVRVITIGYAYIKRGGLRKRIYADTLTQTGVYAHVRNPMYLGNLIIVTGVAMFANYIHFYIMLPFSWFMYIAIIVAEENWLLQKMGDQYLRYKQNVASLWPSNLEKWGKSIEDMRFNWRRVLRKEKGTLFGLSLLLIAVISLKLRLLYRYPYTSTPLLLLGIVALLLLLLYALVYILTATGKLNDRQQI